MSAPVASSVRPPNRPMTPREWSEDHLPLLLCVHPNPGDGPTFRLRCAILALQFVCRDMSGPVTKRSRIVGLAVLMAVAGPACSQPSVRLTEGPREYVAQDYERVLQHWTRSTELLSMSELDNVLSVSATYESWDFRWAYAVRYAEDYRLTIEQRKSLLERTLAESNREHEFFVALYAQKHKWGDLARDNPAWIVRLIDETGNEVAPHEINEIRRPGAIEHTYFPYTSPWRRIFRISFPITYGDGRPTISPKAKWFGLRFAGAQGNDQLVWNVDIRELNDSM